MATGEPTLTVFQGLHRVVRGDKLVLTTLLGSCVAACLWDEGAQVGGMNHFLLPDEDAQSGTANTSEHGAHAMELLVEELLQTGARRHGLRAKLFGGASLGANLTDIGEQNACFAERFLRHQSISLMGGSLRGRCGRRLQFWPMTGRARQSLLAGDVSAMSGSRAPSGGPEDMRP